MSGTAPGSVARTSSTWFTGRVLSTRETLITGSGQSSSRQSRIRLARSMSRMLVFSVEKVKGPASRFSRLFFPESIGVDAVLLQLLSERVAVDPEELGS